MEEINLPTGLFGEGHFPLTVKLEFQGIYNPLGPSSGGKNNLMQLELLLRDFYAHIVAEVVLIIILSSPKPFLSA